MALEDLARPPEFKPFPKMARLHRDMVITEKIDGTNACIVVRRDEASGAYAVHAQSRKRIITPQSDNFGFARWVADHIEELVQLGPGYHYGEWWGLGIQRGYGLDEKRFSLFGPWYHAMDLPECVSTVPVLDRYTFDHNRIKTALNELREGGSRAAPGFDNPEGIVVRHEAARICFKVTLEKDEVPKALADKVPYA